MSHQQESTVIWYIKRFSILITFY